MGFKKTEPNSKHDNNDQYIEYLKEIKAVGRNYISKAAPDGGEGWLEIRTAVQKLLTIDERWSFDSEEHLWWWGSPMVTEVGTEIAEKNKNDGITRRIISAITHVGMIDEMENIDDVYIFLYNWNINKPGCTALLFEHDNKHYVYLNFSLSYSTLNQHMVYAITNSMALQAAFGMDLFRSLSKFSKIKPIIIPHPFSGIRTDADEMALMFHPDNPNPPYFDIADYLDESIVLAYGEIMDGHDFLERGWANSEATFFQLRANTDISVGMGLLSNAETPYGSGVLYGVTTTIKLPIYDKILNAKLVNEMNKFIALAPQKERWAVQLGSVVYSGVEMVNGEAIAISKNSKEENSFNSYSINCFLTAATIRNNDYSTREKAMILSNWAVDWLATGIYLEEFFDNI